MNIDQYKPKERFSNRVADYVRYRPSYPQEIIDTITEYYNVTGNGVIADIGAGSGIFSSLLLKNSFNVMAVEPNEAMRGYAEAFLGRHSNYRSINGSAEKTTLEDSSVDAITVAQAFHWFETESAVKEFRRILKKNGVLFLIWNDRKTDDGGFHEEYHDMVIRHCRDYCETTHKRFFGDRLKEIFTGCTIEEHHFDNHQVFDFNSLLGRLMSSSYSPKESDENYAPLVEELKELFGRHQKDGSIQIDYDCTMFCIKYEQ